MEKSLDPVLSQDMKDTDSERIGEVIRDDFQLNVGGRGATHRGLRNYQVNMIGFCGGIGVGLFVGTGAAYAKAGPLGLFLAYLIVGSVLWCTMQSIAEVAALFPVAGSFPHWATRFIDPAAGFSLAVSYGYSRMISIASEISAAAIIVAYWTDLTPAVVITVGLILILAVNLMPVRIYGDTEVVGGAIKVTCFIGLLIMAVIITAGGTGKGAIGFRYWHNPGPFLEFDGITGSAGHFLAFLSAFVNAAFSYIGIETVIVASAESVNPAKAIPRAARNVTIRIAFFYIFGALMIGLIVDPRNPDLISGSGNANSSPWVIAIKNAGISALPSIVNACILISAWSAGNSYCWTGSRMLLAMTTDHQLPQIFGRVTSRGVPYVAVCVAWLFGPLAYLSGASQAFGWLQNLSTLAGLIAWAVMCFTYIRFYAALKAQGVDRSTLPWKSMFQPFTAWWGFIGASVIALITGFPVFISGHWNTSDFIASYIGIPIFFVPLIGWKIIKKTKVSHIEVISQSEVDDGQFAKASEIDLWAGRLVDGEIVDPPQPTTRFGRFIEKVI